MSVHHTSKRNPLGSDGHRREALRLYITVGSALAIVPLAALAVREAMAGDHWMALLLFVGLGFVVANLLLARRATLTLWPTRVATFFIMVLIVHGIFDAASDLRLLWPLIMPPILLFVYNRGEGLLWAALLLTPCLVFVLLPDLWGATLTPGQAFEFVLAYVATTMFAYAFQSIYERYRIAAQQRAAALEFEELRFKDFAEIGSDWLYELDTDLRFQFVSDNLLEQVGRGQEDFIGQSIEGLLKRLAPEDPGNTRVVAQALRNLEPVEKRRFAMMLDGRVLTLDISLRPIRDTTGKVTGFRGVASDVSEEASQERELREKDRVLYRAQKMEAVGQLTSGLAHDFNNLLTVISGNLDLLQMGGALDTKASDNVGSAKKAAARAADLTSKLLAFARKQPLLPQAANVAELLNSMVDLLERTLGERIDLEVHAQADTWSCRVDPAQFESAILNLAINARDAMPLGGKLRIAADNNRFGGDDVLAEGDYVRVVVEDTGSGISESIREFVFDPFFSTKPQSEGSGLGLSMIYGFVRQSEGDVRILESDESGTRMALYFPRVASLAEVGIEQTGPLEKSFGGGLRVLVLEDEDSVRNMLATMLRAMRCEVSAVATLSESRELLATAEFDLLISDVVLAQGENGLQLVKELRSAGVDLPILLISGYAEPIADETFALDETTQLLSKPFGIQDLTSAIESVTRAQ